MGPAVGPLVALLLHANPAADRVLVCRPLVAGDPALARGETAVEAMRELGGRVLDYGIACESTAEAVRAARRAGLSHAITVAAEGRAAESRFELVIAAEDRVLAVRRLSVPPGGDALRPIAAGLAALLDEVPRPGAGVARRRAAVGLAGGGLAVVAAGAVLAVLARGEAGRANGAATPDEYLDARSAWERARGWSGAAFAVGGAALAAGIAWRIQLEGGDR